MQQPRHFHPVQACDDGLFNTFNGNIINLVHPTEEMIDIRDIANSLSKICRFNGHTNKFYSVAQHSILVAAMAPENIKKEALLHDAAEAYQGDVIKPLKVLLGAAYRSIETVFEHTIAQKFCLYTDDWTHEEIKRLDLAVLEIEHQAFQQGNIQPFVKALKENNLVLDTHAWPPPVAGTVFLAAFAQYFEKD